MVIKLKWDISFIVFIILLLLLAPVPLIIEWCGLRLDYSFSQLLREPWRIISGHLVHGSWSHLLVNLINIILLRLVFHEWLPSKKWLGFIIFSAVFISLGLWLGSELTHYVGFSGVFHGLLLYLLLQSQQLTSQKSMRLLLIAAAVLLIGKVIYEQVFGASEQLANFIGMTVAIDAHLLGVISGLLFWLMDKLYDRYKQSHL